MKTRISCILFFAVCLGLVGTGFGVIFVGNAQFEDVVLDSGEWTYAIMPWLCDNITGNNPAWISYGYFGTEPEPVTPLLYTEGNIVYQKLSATYEEGGVYVFSIDVAILEETDDWEIFFYDATTGDHLTHLASRASTDAGEEPIPVFCEWYRKSVIFAATSAEVGHQIGIGVWGDLWPMFDNAAVTPPVKAWGPDPYDGEINVLIDKTLSWHTGKDPNNPVIDNPDITEHALYMGTGSPTDPNLPNLTYVTSIPATGDTACLLYTSPSPRDRS